MAKSATPPPGAVFDLAERAVEWVRRALGIVLDYTPDTLPVLDHWLGAVPREQTETADLIVTAAGAYFGEVARRELGGQWEGTAAKASAPAEWRLVLTGDVRFCPVGYAATALAKADVDDFDCAFEVPEAERQAVEEALDTRSVPEEEYYSLCGRLEALTYVVELVVARRATRS